MTQSSENTPEGTGTRGGPAAIAAIRWGLIAGAVFVLGLVVGALTVSLLADSPPVVDTADGTSGDDARDRSPLPGDDVSAEFVVSGACLSAVNAAQDTLLVLDDVGEAAAELDAARLDVIVRGLMPLENRLQAGLDECRAATAVDAGPAPGPAAPPTSADPGSPGGD
jgi:hypothetical protein